MSEENTNLIEKTISQVNAILTEADTRPLTGRTRIDLGSIPEGASVASIVDHTLLRADALPREVERLCFHAKEYGFAAVCVNSMYVPLASELLRETDIAVCSVVGFPLGASLPHVKAFETQEAIEFGATEIDMVISIGALKSRDFVSVFEDITDVAYICHNHGETEALCKVILEVGLLTDTEIIMACQLAKQAGADFVKTSTGFQAPTATLEQVKLMRQVVGDGMGVKVSGGIENLAQAQAFINAGANRIGSSSGVRIASEELGEVPTE